jgi:two-component system nitrogen regulation sensor histidine kinase NtrY
VRLTTESEGTRGHGYVITLDDITDLVTAQRSTAWADVARRIAHEIKNPLTPIQLSAERLRRRFGRVIKEDREIFDQCTDTIVRQVGDIGRMVDEFSAFARMPKPTIELRNLSESIREAVFLLEVSHPEISFEIDLPEEPLIGRLDARLMAQALTNIVKNAAEAVAAATGSRQEPGLIKIVGRHEGDSIVVDVIDNGIGLPEEGRRRLLEPYMTTREKGTGLGLAIVTKIIEDHGGRIDLLDSPEAYSGGRGALVRITLPRAEMSKEETKPAAGEQPQVSPAKQAR